MKRLLLVALMALLLPGCVVIVGNNFETCKASAIDALLGDPNDYMPPKRGAK